MPILVTAWLISGLLLAALVTSSQTVIRGGEPNPARAWIRAYAQFIKRQWSLLSTIVAAGFLGWFGLLVFTVAGCLLVRIGNNGGFQ